MRKKNKSLLNKKMKKQMDQVDVTHLNKYFDLFDRILLYNIAVNALPQDAIKTIINNWTGLIKDSINLEAQGRTEFMESTPDGRMLTKLNHPDGESLRLQFLATLDFAKHIIELNLNKHNSGENDFGINSDSIN